MSASLWFLFVILSILVSAQTLATERHYVVKKDMISAFKADRFSIYSDKKEKYLRYRIESYYSPMQKIELYTYPQKQFVGSLDAHQLGTWYEARFEVLDTRNKSNNWFTGHVKRNFALFSDQYTIHLAERTIIMQSRFYSRSYKFFNEADQLSAVFKRRYFVLSGATIYDLEILSSEFPDGVYILALAAYDHKRSQKYPDKHSSDPKE